MTEPMDLLAEGRYISVKNVKMTLAEFLRRLNEYRDDVPLEFKIAIKELPEE